MTNGLFGSAFPAIPLLLAVGLLFVHVLGDFHAQTDWMAQHKSKSWRALTHHVFVAASLDMDSNTLYDPWVPDIGNRHRFFVTIGWDQWIHATTLLVTASWWLQ